MTQIFHDYGEPLALEHDPLKVLLYGETGAGKSWSLRTLPAEMLPAVLIDLDKGSRSLRNAFKPGQFQTALIDTHTTQRGITKPTGYEQAKKAVQASVTLEPAPKTLIIDSFTRLYQCVFDYVLHKQNRTDEETPQLQDYGLAKRLTERFLEASLSTGMNIIFIFHEKAYASEITGIEKGVPAVTGQLGDTLPRFFDEIYHAVCTGRGDKREYKWETAPTGKYIARSRLNLDPRIEQDFSLIHEKAASA